jgi:acetolactate synthase regulatory subunit
MENHVFRRTRNKGFTVMDLQGSSRASRRLARCTAFVKRSRPSTLALRTSKTLIRPSLVMTRLYFDLARDPGELCGGMSMQGLSLRRDFHVLMMQICNVNRAQHHMERMVYLRWSLRKNQTFSTLTAQLSVL